MVKEEEERSVIGWPREGATPGRDVGVVHYSSHLEDPPVPQMEAEHRRNMVSLGGGMRGAGKGAAYRSQVVTPRASLGVLL